MGWVRMAGDFIMLLGTASSLNLGIVYFCSFSFNVFELWLTMGS